MTDTPKAASMSLGDANDLLTSPGQMFEMEDVDIFGVTTRTWKQAPQSLRVVLDLSLGHGEKDYIVYEDERISFEEHYRRASTLAHR
jgi:hypothetical protein